MKKATIEQVFNQHPRMNKILEVALENIIAKPIYTKKEESTIDSAGVKSTVTDYFCSACSKHFSLPQAKYKPATCPRCGNECSHFYQQINTDIKDGFALSGKTKFMFCNESEYKKNASLQYTINGVERKTEIIHLLSKEVWEDKTYIIIREYKVCFALDLTSGDKIVPFVRGNHIIAFNGEELVNIRDGKKSTASFINSNQFAYNFRGKRTIVAEENDILEATMLLYRMNGTSKTMVFEETNKGNLYEMNTTVLDDIVENIKNKKPTSKVTMNKETRIKHILSLIPEKNSFEKETDLVFYTTKKVDELARIEDIEFACPHCGALTKSIRTRFYVRNYTKDVHVCEHCMSEIDDDYLSNYKDNNGINVPVIMVQDIGDDIMVYDWRYKQTVIGKKFYYTPVKDGYAPDGIVIIHKDKSSMPTILRKAETGNGYVFAKQLKPAVSCSIINATATNDNVHWSGLEKISDVLYNAEGVAAYIWLYKNYPVMEKIVKEGFTKIAMNIIQTYDFASASTFPDKYDLSQNDVASVFRVSKSCLKIMKENNVDTAYPLVAIQALYSADNNLMNEDYKYIIENRVSEFKVAEIAKEFGLSIHSICKYLERVRIAQCVNPEIAVNEWCDYLSASKTIGCNMDDKRVKYPAALRTEHDKVMYKKRIIDNADYENRFREVTEEYGKKYSFENKDFMITHPKSLNDLFEEGRKLNHCAGSYGDLIKDGKSIVLFARKKNEPDVPYFTIEVNPIHNVVTQLYGMNDTPPHKLRDAELIAFVQIWALTNEIGYKSF